MRTKWRREDAKFCEGALNYDNQSLYLRLNMPVLCKFPLSTAKLFIFFSSKVLSNGAGGGWRVVSIDQL